MPVIDFNEDMDLSNVNDPDLQNVQDSIDMLENEQEMLNEMDGYFQDSQEYN